MTERSAERRVRQETGWLAGGPLLRVPTTRRTTHTFLFISHTTNVLLSFISSNLIHNSYISYIKLNASTCFERHPLIFRRSMMLTLRRLMSYIYMEHPFLMFLDHTQRRSTVGRTPLDE